MRNNYKIYREILLNLVDAALAYGMLMFLAFVVVFISFNIIVWDFEFTEGFLRSGLFYRLCIFVVILGFIIGGLIENDS